VDRYRLHINPAGARSLRACLPAETWQDFLATAGKPGGGFGFLDDQLRALVIVEDDIMYPPSDDAAERWYPVDRRTLRRQLLTGLDDVVRFGATFERYESSEDRVTAVFADGSTATGDVLVGADGANSLVRQQYLPEAGRVDTGAVGIGLKLPLTPSTRAWLPPRLATGENIIMTAAPFFLFTSVFETGDGDYLLCAFVARDDGCPLDGDDPRQTVARLIENWHPALRRLIAECDPASAGRYPFLAAAPITPWDSTNIVLLGDAVHSMPPTGGLGANTALRDARLLATQLTAAARGEKALRPAIAEYEAEMRVYGDAAVRSSLTTLRQGLTSNAAGLAAMRAWFRLSAAVPALKRRGFRETWNKDARPRPWEDANTAS
jgi:2-polyprenyl-6-methoxyphenol hydroxylase-like FAD-dependent oxidoreductase